MTSQEEGDLVQYTLLLEGRESSEATAQESNLTLPPGLPWVPFPDARLSVTGHMTLPNPLSPHPPPSLTVLSFPYTSVPVFSLGDHKCLGVVTIKAITF